MILLLLGWIPKGECCVICGTAHAGMTFPRMPAPFLFCWENGCFGFRLPQPRGHSQSGPPPFLLMSPDPADICGTAHAGMAFPRMPAPSLFCWENGCFGFRLPQPRGHSQSGPPPFLLMSPDPADICGTAHAGMPFPRMPAPSLFCWENGCFGFRLPQPRGHSQSGSPPFLLMFPDPADIRGTAHAGMAFPRMPAPSLFCWENGCFGFRLPQPRGHSQSGSPPFLLMFPDPADIRGTAHAGMAFPRMPAGFSPTKNAPAGER